eukprot:3907291-Rhodomonas_salina.1
MLPQSLQARARLPSYAKKEEVIHTIAAARVTVISGETGCGKTTQVPLQVLCFAPSAVFCSKCCVLLSALGYAVLRLNLATSIPVLRYDMLLPGSPIHPGRYGGEQQWYDLPYLPTRALRNVRYWGIVYQYGPLCIARVGR